VRFDWSSAAMSVSPEELVAALDAAVAEVTHSLRSGPPERSPNGPRHTRGPGALHYMHQAKAGFVGSMHSSAWYKGRTRRNYGAD
jgi:hypothetical protein